MKGVLLVNFGGALSEHELKQVLFKMFNDRYIIPAPYPVRKLLAWLISNKRYKRSWKDYQKIGGTPVFKETENIASGLEKELNNYKVKTAYSYSIPYIEDVLSELIKEKIFDVTVIPLYPQYSICTTESIKSVVDRFLKKNPELKINFIRQYHNNNHYINFWVNLIRIHTDIQKYKDPLLLFSAHSIPLALIKRGDTYREAITESAGLISQALQLSHMISYQSAINKKTWLGPDTTDTLKDLSGNDTPPIIIVPISFVTENLETLHGIDHIIIPIAKKEYNINNISRVTIPSSDENFIHCLQNLIYEQN